MVSQAKSTDRVKSRIAGLMLAGLVLVLMGMFNLPYTYVETSAKWTGALDVAGIGSQGQYRTLPSMAGWPLRYSVQYDLDGRAEFRYWSTSKLVANLILSLCAAVCVYAYIQIRNWKISVARDRRLTQFVFDVGTSLAILIVPLAALGWHYSIAHQHRRIASQLHRYGNCYMSCWIPEPLVDHVPNGLVHSLMRLRQVQLYGPDQQAVERLAQLPTLVAFHSFGGTFDTKAIEPLIDNLHFSGLGLNRRSLNGADVELVTRLRWLNELSMSRSELTTEMLRRLDGMSRLRVVDLSNTDFTLAELGSPDWSATVEELYLSRPATGAEGSLNIDGWPRLRRLSVSRLSTDMNDAILRIQLSNLPSLELLRLDRNQKHDLILDDLPRLSRIDEDVATLQRILGASDRVPGLPWVSNFHADGVSSLPRIDCFARDLETFSIGEATGLKSIALGSYLISAMGYPSPQPADPNRCQEWLYELGNGEGPTYLELGELPIGHADLSPLLNNSRIRRLGLRNSGITFDQIKQLGPMKQIEKLDIGSCRLEADQLTWILREFPKLESLAVDGAGLSRFDLTANRDLKRITTSMLENPTELRIVDHPSVETFVTMARSPQVMEIRNAYSLRGLALRGPWPKGAKISGLRDLEWFAGGGKEIDDALLDVLLNCPSLDQLTLAYTSVSRQKAFEIGQFDELTLLSVPGMDIDDEVTANWHRIESLWEANFDDTSVSVGTIAWLSGIPSLRRLSLNRVPLSNAAADALSEVRQICELRLAGVSIAPEKLKQLLEITNIESLDISGHPVNADVVDAINSAAALKHLVLHNSDISAELLHRILDANPMIYVDLGQVPEFADDQLLSELNQRARLVRMKFNSGWRQVFLAIDGSPDEYDSRRDQTRMISLVEPPRTGTIVPHLFRPEPNRRNSDD